MPKRPSPAELTKARYLKEAKEAKKRSAPKPKKKPTVTDTATVKEEEGGDSK